MVSDPGFRRDFTRPAQRTPALRTSPPQAQGEAPLTPPKKKSKKLLFIFLAVLLAVAAGASWFYMHQSKSPFPADIRQNSNFSLYYPTKLPAGYQLNKQSISLSNSILTYSADQGADHLNFTIQSKPATFDYPGFYQQVLTNTDQFLTPNGQAAVGTSQGRLVGSLVAGQTWLILSTTSKNMKPSDFKFVLNNLKQD